MTTKIYCFGNEFIHDDSLAKIIVDEISYPGIEFVKSNQPEDLMNEKGRIIIIDVVKDIDKVILITDIEQLKSRDLFTLHDFDLGYFLKLMQSMSTIKEVRIIGIPQQGDRELIKEGILEQLDSMAPFR